MEKIRVIFISSVKPEESSAASVNFYRHLVGREEIELNVLPAEHFEISGGSFFSRILPKLRQTPLRGLAEYLDHLLHRHRDFSKVLPSPKQLGISGNAVILTLAYKSGCWVAQNYAKRYGLPLAVRFDDWWPDCTPYALFFKNRIEKDWIKLAREADVPICISEGMREALGLGVDSPVVLPIPPLGRKRSSKPASDEKPFRVCYLGNMSDYGPMLEGLARLALKQDRVRIEFRGPKPSWDEDFQADMGTKGLLHGFGQGEEFEKWFNSFDAYLVAMFFDKGQRRRVETCFATKLMEYIALGKPIVIWAPESAAVTKWAISDGRALCVNSPDPQGLLASLSMLAENLPQQIQLGNAARSAYERDCSPVKLQNEFLLSLRRAF
jgi:glycosyltransferase involved in cell wall biosynthesis